MDVVYVVRAAEHNEELRFSLRSLVNLPHEKVWIAGHKPAWVSEAVGHIPTVQRGTKYANTTANLVAACRHPEVSERFALFNDDFFVMSPLASLPVYHRGPLREVEEDLTRRGYGAYLTGMRQTRALLSRLGIDDPLSYELHVPLPMTKAGFLAAMEAAEASPPPPRILHKRTLYGNHAGVGGEFLRDCKIANLGREPSRVGLFLSTTERSFTGGVGRFIQRVFPEPSPYEQLARVAARRR